jgi:acyl CoA:acetate/3-ketoacid CoA transferase alpha subunit
VQGDVASRTIKDSQTIKDKTGVKGIKVLISKNKINKIIFSFVGKKTSFQFILELP